MEEPLMQVLPLEPLGSLWKERWAKIVVKPFDPPTLVIICLTDLLKVLKIKKAIKPKEYIELPFPTIEKGERMKAHSP